MGIKKKGSRYIGHTPFRGPSSWEQQISKTWSDPAKQCSTLDRPRGSRWPTGEVEDSFRRGEALDGNEAKEVCEVPADEVLQRGKVWL